MPFHDHILRSLLAGLLAGLTLVALGRLGPSVPALRGEPPALPRALEGEPPAFRGFA